MTEVNAHAKINLSLEITGTKGNFHLLDTVIIPVPLCDTVRLEKRNDNLVEVKYVGREGIYLNDTAKKTAEKIVERYRTCGVNIEIVKRIPEGAGLGGSSADAAGVAKGMEILFGYGSTDKNLLASIGSDVPAMYYGAPCRVRGIGEEITAISIAKTMKFAVLLNKSGVSTRDCYALYDRLGGEGADTEKVCEALNNGEYFPVKNDLYPSAVKLNSDVEEAKSALKQAGFIAGMTGSGSAVFGYEYDGDAFTTKLERLNNLAKGKFEIITF